MKRLRITSVAVDFSRGNMEKEAAKCIPWQKCGLTVTIPGILCLVGQCIYSRWVKKRAETLPASTRLKSSGLSLEETMDKYVCPCGYVYDPAVGDPDNGVAPGTPWEQVPESWVCPVCEMGKEVFEKE